MSFVTEYIRREKDILNLPTHETKSRLIIKNMKHKNRAYMRAMVSNLLSVLSYEGKVLSDDLEVSRAMWIKLIVEAEVKEI
jgi:hypothetical protein